MRSHGAGTKRVRRHDVGVLTLAYEASRRMDVGRRTWHGLAPWEADRVGEWTGSVASKPPSVSPSARTA